LKKAVTLLSGGLDSTVALVMSLEKAHVLGYTTSLVLCFRYGQQAEACEVEASKKIANYYGLEFLEMNITWLGSLKGCALTDPSLEIPDPSSESLDDLDLGNERAKQVWVPNRNGLFINVAASVAESRDLDRIVIGFNAEEAATFPDNSMDFLKATNQALRFSTQKPVMLSSPTVGFDKRKIFEVGMELNAPFEMIWSCYRNTSKMCGRCESCQRLKRASRGASVIVSRIEQ